MYDKEGVLRIYSDAIQTCHGQPQPLLNLSELETEQTYSRILKFHLDLFGYYSTILDLGCGCGNPVSYLNNKNIRLLRYTGYDINSEMIEVVRQRFAAYPNMSFEVKDLTDLEDKSYDIIIGNESFVYIKNTEDLIRVVKHYIDHANKVFTVSLLLDTSRYDKSLILPQQDIGALVKELLFSYQGVSINNRHLENKVRISVYKDTKNLTRLEQRGLS